MLPLEEIKAGDVIIPLNVRKDLPAYADEESIQYTGSSYRQEPSIAKKLSNKIGVPLKVIATSYPFLLVVHLTEDSKFHFTVDTRDYDFIRATPKMIEAIVRRRRAPLPKPPSQIKAESTGTTVIHVPWFDDPITGEKSK